ncbi:hypothetical protein DYB38_007493 [Aphanomyces astaci]|uniref:N-acetyltransferase domain-containing protein n=1 Tax=Aphanomyces astaci TaxID=112090 RepID=A0A397E8Z7_APHAT|nr:hypothetical protein DYB38_007493 [Aphanomyces astaci]
MRRADPIGTNQIGTRALSAASGLKPETDSRFWVVRRENDAGIDAVAMWTSLTGIFLNPSFRPSDAAEFGHHLAQLLPDPLPQSSECRVVGFAAHHPPVVTEGEAIFRVGPVFVTPQERRRGYASAMTAELSRLLKVACQTASRVMLFADANNPASNKAYQNVGFVQASEVGVYNFVE